MKISSRFDAGNIEVISADTASDIQLSIKPDNGSDFFQWFYFRVQGASRQALTMRITNAADAAYAEGWDGYQAVASYDRQCWFRVPTQYEKGELILQHEPSQASIYYAYFAPYSHEQHLDLVARAQQSHRCQLIDLGNTIDGRDIELLKLSSTAHCSTDQAINIWVTARQHPGETMAEWLVEGLLERLVDQHDALSRQLLERCVFWVVPNMNPDGSVRGHLRTNAVGTNLNREWHDPTPEKSPEVLVVREKMKETGVDLYLDIHGDETLPCNFIAGQAGSPLVSDDILTAERIFKENLARINPDFQVERGYEPGKFGQETLTIASFWVGETFGCPAMTLEMPFKDYDKRPDLAYGWSPERSKQLGKSLLHPIAEWLEQHA
ncbi:M14-type cytosolic carboxypeptidase [Neptunomonas sp. CHC150]|uniref:M14 family metallopeptidase n=1 Tax=Neptunomonas sp. CHC150 TaxID=2998324 RepID=UPI0025B2186A|nr:M14-type cytosolic carboxypeptidase [Neptunomonas sp. CHC150]MDN2661382.1 M14-type cytosolic carboxypeptidase [Neptunomonas sp. CHC150]